MPGKLRKTAKKMLMQWYMQSPEIVMKTIKMKTQMRRRLRQQSKGSGPKVILELMPERFGGASNPPRQTAIQENPSSIDILEDGPNGSIPSPSSPIDQAENVVQSHKRIKTKLRIFRPRKLQMQSKQNRRNRKRCPKNLPKRNLTAVEQLVRNTDSATTPANDGAFLEDNTDGMSGATTPTISSISEQSLNKSDNFDEIDITLSEHNHILFLQYPYNTSIHNHTTPSFASSSSLAYVDLTITQLEPLDLSLKNNSKKNNPTVQSITGATENKYNSNTINEHVADFILIDNIMSAQTTTFDTNIPSVAVTPIPSTSQTTIPQRKIKKDTANVAIEYESDVAAPDITKPMQSMPTVIENSLENRDGQATANHIDSIENNADDDLNIPRPIPNWTLLDMFVYDSDSNENDKDTDNNTNDCSHLPSNKNQKVLSMDADLKQCDHYWKKISSGQEMDMLRSDAFAAELAELAELDASVDCISYGLSDSGNHTVLCKKDEQLPKSADKDELCDSFLFLELETELDNATGFDDDYIDDFISLNASNINSPAYLESTSVPTTSQTKTNTVFKVENIFGTTCSYYLKNECPMDASCRFSHTLKNTIEVENELQQLSDLHLLEAYRFMLIRAKLYCQYFGIFCNIYAGRKNRSMLLNMVSDCERYVKYPHFLRNVFYSLLRCNMSKEYACQQILQRSQIKCTSYIDVLVSIIVESDWTNFCEHLERLAAGGTYKFNIEMLQKMASVLLKSFNAEHAKVLFTCLMTLPTNQIALVKNSPQLTQFLKLLRRNTGG